MNDLDLHKSNNRTAVTSMIIVGAALMLSVLFYDIGHAVIIAGMFITQGILYHKRIFADIFSFLFPFTVLMMVAGSQEVFDLYARYFWFDKVVHFMAEFVLTLLAGYLLAYPFRLEVKQKLTFFIIVVSVGITLGAVWEIVEWLLTFIIPPSFDYTATDTATDLIIDSLGAIAAGFLSVAYNKKKSHIGKQGIIKT